MNRIFMPMSTTRKRHNRLIGTIYSVLNEFMRLGQADVTIENCNLAHYGTQSEPASLSLVDIALIKDIEDFINNDIEDLDYVQPDLMLFKKNKFLEDSKGIKTAGYPDLIVEVWSGGNPIAHRETKRLLYSTSPVTEHWYIEQDSNEVICYFGSNKIESQYLTGILVTQDGLEFDLRYLAI